MGEIDVEKGSYGTFNPSSALPRRGPRSIVAGASVLAVLVVVGLVLEAQQMIDYGSAVQVILFQKLSAPVQQQQQQQQQQQAPPAFDASSFQHFLPSDMAALVNFSVDPCHDFHEFACGTWESETVIKPEKTSASYSWDLANERRQEGLQHLMETDQGLVGNFYRACMNLPLSNELGTKPVDYFMFPLIESIRDRPTLALAIAELHKVNADIFFSWFASTDHLDPTKTILYLTNGGLNLPDKEYYLSKEAEYEHHRAAYRTYLVNGLQLYNFSKAKAEEIAADTLKIETLLAGVETDEDNLYKLKDVPPRYNNSGLISLLPNFDWKTYFGAWGHADVGTNDAILSVNRPQWLHAMDGWLASENLETLKNYLRGHVLHYFSPMLSQNFLDLELGLDHELYGTEAITPRYKKCIGAAQHAMPLPVGKLFVENMLSPAVKAAVTGMLEEVRSAFIKDIDTVPWMTPSVKLAAKTKLLALVFEVAYPAEWPTFPFTMTDHTYVENSLAAFRYATQFEFDRLFHPVNRHEWGSSPAEINAFYSNGVNAIFVPGGILESPFFNISYPQSVNYGSLGSVLGHETSHSLDNTGRKYDSTGARRQWWDDTSIQQYDERAQCVATLFNGFVVQDVHVHGNDTLGEDLADLGGVKMSYNAFVSKYSPKIEEKRTFWTAFAQSWCSKQRALAAKNQVLTDEHPPDKFRILGPLSQLPEFAADFSCPAGSPMNPEKKCVLW